MVEGVRYAQLIALVPAGSFYRARGAIVPLRGRRQPYEFLLTAPEGQPSLPPLRNYTIVVNGEARGVTSTDANGEAVVELALGQGDNAIEFVDVIDQRRIRASIMARAYATLMAAHAEVLEGIDAGIDAAQAGVALATAPSDYLSSPHGRLVGQGPLASYGAAPGDESYRLLLRWLRQAFREHGATLRGLRQAVAPYSASLPFRVPKAWRKTWRLGVDLMPNGRLEQYTRQLDEAYANELREPFPVINAASYDYVMAAEAQTAGASAFAGPFTAPPVPQRLVLVFTTATWGAANVVTVNGTGGSGEAISEAFDPAFAVALDGTRSAVVGTQTFVSVTSATQAGGAGVATASLGLYASRFVRLVGDGLDSYHSPAESLTLLHLLVANALIWDNGILQFLPAEPGRLVLPRIERAANLYGLVATATGVTTLTYATQDERFLLLEANDLGPVLVDLGTAAGWPTSTLAAVATVIDAAFLADVRYGAGYSPIAQAVAGPGTLTALALYTTAPDTFLQSLAVRPLGPDAAPVALGLPKVSTRCSAAITVPGTVLSLANGLLLPERQDLFVGTLGDTTATPLAVTFTPETPQALEVVFEAGCRFTAVVVTGTDRYGNLVQETFTRDATASLVSDGTFDATVAAGTVVTKATDFDVAIAPGDFFRWTSGAGSGVGALVRSNAGYGVVGLGLLSAVTVQAAQSWEVHRQVRVEGTQAFATVTEVLGVGASGAGSIRAATVYVAGADEKGYPVRVGRGLSKTGAASVTFAASAPVTAVTFLGLTPPEGFDACDVGGWVLIENATSPGNNGLHEVVGIVGFGLGDAAVSGNNVLRLRHQNAPVGAFVAGTDAGAITWRLYSRGELATVTNRTFATPNLPRLYPPGVLFAHPANSAGRFPLVELEGELPKRVEQTQAGTLTVDVDPTLALTTGGPYTDTVTVSDNYVLPDGWIGSNISLPTGANVNYPGELDSSRLTVTVFFGSADLLLYRSAGVELTETYRGFVVRALCWVAQHLSTASADFYLEFSPDGGSTWTAGTVPPDTVSAGAAAAYPQPVARTVLVSPVVGGPLASALVAAQYTVPYDATDLWVRLRVPTDVGDTGFEVSLERFQLVAVANLTAREAVTGLALGQAAIALSEHRAKFGEVLYVWPHAALAEEDGGATAVGLGLPSAGSPDSQVDPRGTIDRIVNAHGVWDRYDVGEYGAGPAFAVANLAGCYDDLGWLAATLTNLEVVPGVPARTAYLRPTAVSAAEETFEAGTGPVFTLAEDSTHASPGRPDEGDALLADGEPVPHAPPAGVDEWTEFAEAAAVFSTPLAGLQTVSGLATSPPSYLVGRTLQVAAATDPLNEGRFLVMAVGGASITFENPTGAAAGAGAATLRYAVEGADPWTFTAADQVTVDASEYDASAVYTARYTRILRAETPAFDLGAAFGDYLWLVDATVRTRADVVESTYRRTDQLLFVQGRATLPVRSDGDAGNATLTVTDAVSTRVLPFTAWRFVDPSIVEVTGQNYDDAAVYVLEYDAVLPSRVEPASYTVETRSSNVSTADVLLQAWREVALDELVDRAHRYHQLRITFSGVTDTRDVEVLGLGLRGLHLSGADAYAPGII